MRKTLDKTTSVVYHVNMKTKGNSKGRWMSIRLDDSLKKQVEELARNERRSLGDQAAYLMEQGLKALKKAEEAKETAQKKPAA